MASDSGGLASEVARRLRERRMVSWVRIEDAKGRVVSASPLVPLAGDGDGAPVFVLREWPALGGGRDD